MERTITGFSQDDAGAAQPIPPEIDHDVEPQGRVRFFVEFLAR